MSGDSELVFSKEYIAFQETNGLRCVLPADNEIQIDIDTEADYERWRNASQIFFRYREPISVIEKPSLSGLPRRHITVTLPYAITVWERIALQASLGSDHIREILSCLQYMEGDPNPCLLTEK